MPASVAASATLITLALVFYSLGVWSERFARYLKLWHVAAFWTGFLFDLSGTWSMHRLAQGRFDLSDPHTLTGQIALWSCWPTLSGPRRWYGGGVSRHASDSAATPSSCG